MRFNVTAAGSLGRRPLCLVDLEDCEEQRQPSWHTLELGHEANIWDMEPKDGEQKPGPDDLEAARSRINLAVSCCLTPLGPTGVTWECSRCVQGLKSTALHTHTHTHTHTKIRTSPIFWRPKTLCLWRRPKCLQKIAPRRNKLDHCAIIKFPLTTESAMKKMEDNTLVFIVDVKASKHQIKQAVKQLSDMEVAKGNALLRAAVEKKAYVPLAPHYEALDVANKIGII
ncbi:large ribosomal subunit protein uL23-like [Cynocephalus volans]|uniref:large ribosomal subunit protein uL23-like n=1 Tax=Cynocephalus volans TaxID=110931 RepID=UPI002FC61CFD